MEKFEVNILGCGSATPTLQHHPSAQVINIREKLFMVDCGEGTQLQFRRSRLQFNKLTQIFISHLHGDHCFGLIGLISTLALLGRTGELTIHAPQDLQGLLQPQLDYFCRENPFKVNIEPFATTENKLIYEDRSVKVYSIPLIHRVPCSGFLFREQPGLAHILPEMIKFYNVPVRQIANIKKGADFVTEDGTIISNNRLTRASHTPRSYAYCSDTAYSEAVIPIIEGVDLLYHEATFSTEDAVRAKQTGHSTAIDAARIAEKANVKKLMLGHFSSRYTDNTMLQNEALQIFPNTILANEGLCEKL